MKLIKIEKYLKYQYFTYGSSFNLDSLHKDFDPDGPMFEHNTLYNLLLNNSIESDLFLKDNQSIAIYRHLRYLPVKLHKHNQFEVIYVFSGNAKNNINGDESIMKSGDVCILAPNTTHSINQYIFG